MQIGDKILLVNASEESAKIRGVQQIFVEAVIVKIETGRKGEFSRNIHKNSKSYLADGNDGYQYGYNWDYVNESFSDTKWKRWVPDNEFMNLSNDDKSKFIKNRILSDITDLLHEKRPSFLSEYDYLLYCEKHKILFYSYDSCFECFMGTKTDKAI